MLLIDPFVELVEFTTDPYPEPFSSAASPTYDYSKARPNEARVV